VGGFGKKYGKATNDNQQKVDYSSLNFKQEFEFEHGILISLNYLSISSLLLKKLIGSIDPNTFK